MPPQPHVLMKLYSRSSKTERLPMVQVTSGMGFGRAIEGEILEVHGLPRRVSFDAIMSGGERGAMELTFINSDDAVERITLAARCEAVLSTASWPTMSCGPSPGFRRVQDDIAWLRFRTLPFYFRRRARGSRRANARRGRVLLFRGRGLCGLGLLLCRGGRLGLRPAR